MGGKLLDDNEVGGAVCADPISAVRTAPVAASKLNKVVDFITIE